MAVASTRTGWVVALTLSAGLLWSTAAARAAENPDGHAIAQKFATEADKASKDELRKKAEAARRAAEAKKKRETAERQKSEEADMLTRARQEADQRRAAQDRERAADEQAAWQEAALEAARKAEAERLAAEQAIRDKAEKEQAERVAAEARAKAEQERIAAEARARAEQERVAAEARARAEQERVAAEARAKAEQERVAAEARAKAEQERIAAEARAKAEQERIAAEARAKAEQERVAAEARARAEQERIAAEARAKAEQERIAAEARAKAEQERVAAAAEAESREAMARERDAEADRIIAALRQARAAQAARQEAKEPAAEPASRGEPVTSAPATVRHATEREDLSRVTIILQMQPGNRGIRRHNKTADPVLCGDAGCYVSNGPGAPASLLGHHRALGFGRTWGARAGACSNSLGCVFRGVDVAALGGWLQPVDMRVLHHDRREPHNVRATSGCELRRGQITCRHSVQGPDYVLWVVPEALAEAAGAGVLDRATSHDDAPGIERIRD